MSLYFSKPYEPFVGDTNVKVDLSNYATKSDFYFFLVSMESIAKYFESSKKRYLSDGSKTSEEPKKKP